MEDEGFELDQHEYPILKSFGSLFWIPLNHRPDYMHPPNQVYIDVLLTNIWEILTFLFPSISCTTTIKLFLDDSNY